MPWGLIVRCTIGVIVGWIVGVMLARITFAIDNWLLNRSWKRRQVQAITNQ